MDRSRELAGKAVDTIGRDETTDYRIKPTEYPDRVPELATLLRHAALTETARRFEERDAAALAAQKAYKRMSITGTWCLLAASTAAAVLAALSTAGPTPGLHAFRIVLASVALAGGVTATGVLYVVNHRQLLHRWMRYRSSAEAERIGYFNKMTRLALEESPSEVWTHLLVLELFRRYQLDPQQSYYASRAKEHLHSRSITVLLGAAAAMILAGAGGGLGLWAVLSGSEAVSLAALGTIGAGVATVASRREELTQDERNAERYERTADKLSRLREMHTETQEALAGGRPHVLLNYVAAVHETLSNEHREWVEDTQKMDEALHNLSTALERERKPSGSDPIHQSTGLPPSD